MPKRKTLSKKIRFEVFKRDSFVCQYCDSTPPNVVLEVDHVIPVSKNGRNDINNLLTACFDCNRGKSNNLLNDIPKTLAEKSLLIEEKETQIKEFSKLLNRIRSRESRDIKKINDVYTSYFDEWELGDKFKESTL